MSHNPSRFLGILLTLLTAGSALAQRDLAGTALIEQSLAKLNVLGSVLMVAAHPDDENNPVVAYLARGRHLRTGYLSATRGEGGQNLIGSEQGDLLGIIRTQELLAARRVDGAEQFFTRAIDFGFSKSGDEALEKWGREKILSDMVWVMRRFRPDVVIMTFSGTARDGHGQHTASAILGREAFAAAGDPTRFPEQLQYVEPWKPRRAMQSQYRPFTPGQMPPGYRIVATRVEINPGEYDPILGRSYAEIGAISRSMHRCQAEGSAQAKGDFRTYLVPVAGDAPEKDLFDGIDITWNRLPGGAAVGALLRQAAAEFRPAHPERIVPLLAKARPLLAAIGDPLAKIKLAELDETIALCTGLWIDAQAARYEVTPGADLGVTLSLLNRSPLEITVESAALEGMWNEKLETPAAPLAYNQVSRIQIQRQVPAGQPYSQPYWLAAPRQGDTYAIGDLRLIGMPENPAVLTARVRLRVEGAVIELTRPVQHRYVDRGEGERTRPLAIVPPVAVDVPEDVLLFPTAAPRRVKVELRGNVAQLSGEVALRTPAGWKVSPASRPFRIAEAGQQEEVSFEVTPPAGDSTGVILAVAAVGGREFSSGTRVIQYSHIPAQTLFPRADAKLVRASVKVTARRVGYVMGAGDDMPDALRQLGCEVTLLSQSDLEQRNLGEFDAIVAGVRAYNVRMDLRANHPRLMEYVRNGGTYIVQYTNIRDGAVPPLGPYPFTITNDRVTVEDAPVAFAAPEHPLLKTPNQIIARDFEGWIQERGLYFATQWDPRYQTVIETHDPGDKPLAGGLLYAKVGKGVYVFTAYSWFRELPAGVPGAYRVFANLLSAK